jgi:hypothetical protein
VADVELLLGTVCVVVGRDREEVHGGGRVPLRRHDELKAAPPDA